MLLYLTFPSLFAPAFYGMCIFLFKFLLGPYVGAPEPPAPQFSGIVLPRMAWRAHATAACARSRRRA
eukprot:6142402-Prymnesium_polylepis.1